MMRWSFCRGTWRGRASAGAVTGGGVNAGSAEHRKQHGRWPLPCKDLPLTRRSPIALPLPKGTERWGQEAWAGGLGEDQDRSRL
jgi:hypothetical protein